MPDGIFVEGGILVPGDAIGFTASRSSGPGGQNVNKVASKVELRIRLDRIRGLSAEGRMRLRRIVSRRLDREGRLVVTSRCTRDQYRNLQDARRKVHDWVAKAVQPPRRRIPTKPGTANQERRLRAKHHHSEIKRSRTETIFLDD